MLNNRARAAAAVILLGSGLLVAAPTPAVAAASPLPASRLEFGLGNGPGDLSWMTASGVPWKYRYQYLAGGVNTAQPWESWQDPALPPGQFAADYMKYSNDNGYIPVFTWYEVLQSLPSTLANESDRDYANLNTTATMNAYYASFKRLLVKAGLFGKQVVVHIEPDFWGYMQQRASDASTVSASVASSGFADVAGIPNTVQGFGWALLHMRDLYAPNALLAIHASPWSNGGDIASSTNPGMNVVAIADATAAFLGSAGITSNPYGSTWDVVFNDLDDHDAGWWEQQTPATNHWWDPTNTTFPNFTRYFAWVAELKARTNRQQVAWQVPVGNQYFLTMNNTCGHYQDNVAPYFIAHPGDLYAAGLVAVLFGGGASCTTSYTDAQADGVTNNGTGSLPGPPTTDTLGFCNACNTHVSTYADDDGGYLRIFVGQYYDSRFPVSKSASNPAGNRAANQSNMAGPGPRTAVTPPPISSSPAPRTAVVVPPASSPPAPRTAVVPPAAAPLVPLAATVESDDAELWNRIRILISQLEAVLAALL